MHLFLHTNAKLGGSCVECIGPRVRASGCLPIALVCGGRCRCTAVAALAALAASCPSSSSFSSSASSSSSSSSSCCELPSSFPGCKPGLVMGACVCPYRGQDLTSTPVCHREKPSKQCKLAARRDGQHTSRSAGTLALVRPHCNVPL